MRKVYRCRSQFIKNGEDIPEYSQRCQMLKLQTLESRRIEADAIFGIRLLQNSTIDCSPFIFKSEVITRSTGAYHTTGKSKIPSHFYSSIPRICRYMSEIVKIQPNILRFKTSPALKNRISDIDLSEQSNSRNYRFGFSKLL